MANAVPHVNLPAIMERLVLTDFTPSCVLVNRQSEVLCIHGRTGKFLEPAPGTDGRNLLAMARAGLKVHLAAALQTIFEQNESTQPEDVVHLNLRVKTNGHYQTTNLRVRLLTNPPAVQGLALVIFEEVQQEPPPASDGEAAGPDDAQIRIRDLEQEVRISRDHLKTTIEQLETANEELKSSNEELQSTNEELQSINEEHETSKEELQSVNEELFTVNSELEEKLRELFSANNDMVNLLASTEIATLFLDQKLTIKRYTPEVTRIFHLIKTDIGRPFSDIAGSLDYRTLVEDARGVLQSLIPRIKETSTKEGRWYKARILPYRTTDNVIDGVVITFIDISDHKALELQSRLATVVRDSRDAITVMDFDGRVLAWNRGAERLYGLAEADAVGNPVFNVFADRQHADIRDRLRRLARGEVLAPFETLRELRTGKRLRVQVTATLLSDHDGRPQAVATTEREISGAEQATMHLFRALPMPVMIENAQGMLIELNDAAHTIFGGADRPMIGQPAATLVPPNDLPLAMALLERCRQGEKISRVSGRRLDKTGSLRSVLLSLIPLGEPGGAIATIIEDAPSDA